MTKFNYKTDYNRKDIPSHVKSYIDHELKMKQTYQAMISELKYDLEEVSRQYKGAALKETGGNGYQTNTMVEIAAMQKEVIEGKIRDLEWRMRKIDRGLTLLNGDQLKIVECKMAGYNLSYERIMNELGYDTNRNKFFEMLYDIQFKLGVMLGVMPPI